MRVYKYLGSKWGREALQKKRIKISRFHELNDPFDCHAVSFDTDAEREAWQRAIIRIGQDRALTCFSRHFHNPLLWSHYAEDHRGIVLGFDVDSSVGFLDVKYASSFLDCRGFLGFSESRKIQAIKNALSRKYLQWKYENEVRFFIDLDHECRENGLYFLDFGEQLKLCEVIIGPRSNLPMAEIESDCAPFNVRPRKASLSGNKYEIVLD